MMREFIRDNADAVAWRLTDRAILRLLLVAVIGLVLIVLTACAPVNATDHHATGPGAIDRSMEMDCLVHPDEPGCPARIRDLVQ